MLRRLTELVPVWSTAAALRTARAVLVVPALFAVTDKVIGDPQMATFATFGGFATLVMVTFTGTWRDKIVAHLGLAIAASLLIVIGTAVNATGWVAAVVAIPVVFAVLFAGVAGPNAAAGTTPALLAFVLPAASPGDLGMLGSRLTGWWLATVIGTAAVLLLPTPRSADGLRAAAATCARTVADQLANALRGASTEADAEATIASKRALMSAFTATPQRPTGLATADQALASLVTLLEWCCAVVCDSLAEYRNVRSAPEVERNLLAATEETLRDIAALLSGDPAAPDLGRLERCLAESVTYLQQMSAEDRTFGDAVHLSFHARTAALAAHHAAADALIAAGQADPAVIEARRRQWWGLPDNGRARPMWGLGGIVAGHAGLRSVWFRNSMRGALAIAVAIAVAEMTGVQHGFWVVLGTLSVLRTTASATGSTALRALLGVMVGFVIGGLVLLAIGTSQPALWAAFVVAVLIAAYTPGTASFALGQAAFTVTITVLYNILVPVGWRIGVLRIEDVAIGCAVSLVVGVLFWPRGASGVVGDDLAEAYRVSAGYLSHAVSWALGLRKDEPHAAPAVAAGLRLDEALRGFLAEQGTKHLPPEDLWRLAGTALRLRLTGYSLAGLPSPPPEALDQDRQRLAGESVELTQWFDRLADHLSRPNQHTTDLAATPAWPPVQWDVAAPPPGLSCTLWVEQHLQHVTPRLAELIGPADSIAAQRRQPWWR